VVEVWMGGKTGAGWLKRRHSAPPRESRRNFYCKEFAFGMKALERVGDRTGGRGNGGFEGRGQKV
jgi:hypothetical protein